MRERQQIHNIDSTNIMKTASLGALCALLAISIWADTSIDIVVSPHMLVQKSKTSKWVTVHADVSFRTVAADSVVLYIDDRAEQIPASSVFSDDRGDLVAKFDFQKVKMAVAPPRARLVLRGRLIDNSLFSGWDLVPVR